MNITKMKKGKRCGWDRKSEALHSFQSRHVPSKPAVLPCA
jgi:hypothetical protein